MLYYRTIFSCPLGTTSQVKLPITGTILPGPSLVIAHCQETGANAGTWYYGIPPLVTPVEIVATQCQGIISGWKQSNYGFFLIIM